MVLVALAGCGGGGSKPATPQHPVISFRVPSPSMAPTYRVGQHVTVELDAYAQASPQRGDVIVFHPPLGALNGKECGVPSEPADGHPCAKPTPQVAVGTSYIKRIVAVGGDQLKIVRNVTYLGGEAQSEPFVNKASPCSDQLCNLPRTITIPPGFFYVLGDNRGASDDSRDWGPIPKSSIVGKVNPPGS
jgi:signal peptidase I